MHVHLSLQLLITVLSRNHAQNAYMLHALGITHVVSVGECALVPPPNIATSDSSRGYHLVAGRGPGGHGSLWMEEREGRIKVLDIKVRLQCVTETRERGQTNAGMRRAFVTMA